jgi:hypothetical protein
MSPEQRLTIREAVDLIAERGPAPISEAALRARVRARRVGVVRVGGRVYTNPLNLVTAGLLPVEALDGVAAVPRAEIDEAELQAWLNPPDESVSAEGEGSAGGPRPEGRERDVDASSNAAAGARDVAGPLEQALSGGETRSDRAAAREALGGPEAASGARRGDVAGESGERSRRPRAGLLVVVLVALVVGVGIALGGRGGAPSAVPQVQSASLVGVGWDLGETLALAGERAGDRGDYDAALELAAVAGNREAMERWRRAAAKVVLARARRAAGDGRVREARQHLRRLRVRYGDPLPGSRRMVLASVSRVERVARERSAARRARKAGAVAPVVAASSRSAGAGGGSGSSSASSSTTAGAGTDAAGGGSTSRPSSSSTKGPGEFF